MVSIPPNDNRLTNRDAVLFFLLVPLLLLIVFLLPTGLRQEYFTLYPSDPGFPGVFLFNLNHKDLGHLESNAVAYLVTMALLFKIETDRRRFYLMMAVFFLVLPFIIAWVSIAFTPNLPQQVGFSGTVAAIIGYLTYATYLYVKKDLGVCLTSNAVVLVFLFNAAVTTITSNYLLLQAAIFLFLALFIYLERAGLLALMAKAKDGLKGYKNLTFLKRIEFGLGVAFSVLFILFAMPILVPLDIVSGSSLIAIHSHYFGYIIGLFPCLVFEVIFG